MANDRMFLKCNGCNHAILIATHYGGPWNNYGAWIPEGLGEAMDSFFERHMMCGGDIDQHNFSIAYEDDLEDYAMIESHHKEKKKD